MTTLTKGAVHKVRHAIFGQFLPSPPPVTLCHTSRDPLESTSHISDPRFLVSLVQKARTKAPVQILSIVHGAFCQGVLSGGILSGRICPGWFLSIPPSVRIHLLQHKVKHHLKFQVSYV